MGGCEQGKVKVSSECGKIPLGVCEGQAGGGGWVEGPGGSG